MCGGKTSFNQTFEIFTLALMGLEGNQINIDMSDGGQERVNVLDMGKYGRYSSHTAKAVRNRAQLQGEPS